ncbi:MAG: hypothetical protein ACOVQN_12965 [Exiguobacterium sp.]
MMAEVSLSLGDFGKSLRSQFLIITILFGLAFSTFFLGWGQMRYSSTTVIPMEKEVYWRFALAGWLPLVAFFVTAAYVVMVLVSASRQKTNGLTLITWVHFGICLVAAGWCLYFCAISIVGWAECNDPGPRHPECRNREYPAKTVADYSFIMMVISGAVMAAINVWSLYFNRLSVAMRLGLASSGEVQEDIRERFVDAAQIDAHYYDDRYHGKHTARAHHREAMSSNDWRHSMGNK